MRIAVWHNLPSGGGKRALYDHIAGLVAGGHQVEAWCPQTADQTYLPLSELCKERVVPLRGVRPRHRNPIGRALYSIREMAERVQAMDRHCRSCAEDINRGAFDLLFANPCRFFRTSPIGRHVSIPSVLYLQEPFRALYEACPDSPWAALPTDAEFRWSLSKLRARAKDLINVEAQRAQVREEVRNAFGFHTTLVNSLFSRESVLRAYGRESRVCYLGINVARFSPTGESTDDYIVSVGGFNYLKGADRVVSALAEVPRSHRPRLLWVGNFSDPVYAEALHRKAANVGVELELRVRIDDRELVSLLSRARAMIYAPRLEPFGLAPLEANACGIPVIAVAEGGVRETIQHGVNGMVSSSADPKELGLLIQRVLNSRDLYATLRDSARPFVLENWTLERATQRLEAELSATVSNRGPSLSVAPVGYA